MEVRSFDEAGIVRDESERREEIETKGVESMVVVESENARDGVEVNTEEDEESPGSASK